MVGLITPAVTYACAGKYTLCLYFHSYSQLYRKMNQTTLFLGCYSLRSPSHWAPPFSCGGPCKLPGGHFFLQLFSLFLWSSQLLPPSPFLHLKQTLQESRLLLQRGGLFARQARTRTTQGFMHSWISRSTQKKGPRFSSPASKDGPDCASDLIWSTM